jgi:hypothetical protein
VQAEKPNFIARKSRGLQGDNRREPVRERLQIEIEDQFPVAFLEGRIQEKDGEAESIEEGFGVVFPKNHQRSFQ